MSLFFVAHKNLKCRAINPMCCKECPFFFSIVDDIDVKIEQNRYMQRTKMQKNKTIRNQEHINSCTPVANSLVPVKKKYFFEAIEHNNWQCVQLKFSLPTPKKHYIFMVFFPTK